jgi:NtrC-family two-component system response regulator AlgB
MILWPSAIFEPAAFPERIAGGRERGPEVGGRYTVDDIERAHITAVLASTRTMDEAAAILGIDGSTLWRKRKKYEDSKPGS